MQVTQFDPGLSDLFITHCFACITTADIPTIQYVLKQTPPRQLMTLTLLHLRKGAGANISKSESPDVRRMELFLWPHLLLK